MCWVIAVWSLELLPKETPHINNYIKGFITVYSFLLEHILALPVEEKPELIWSQSISVDMSQVQSLLRVVILASASYPYEVLNSSWILVYRDRNT